MSIRLSSFLTDVERGLQADNPILKGGTWDIGRTLNYNSGLARLALATRPTLNSVEPLGSVLLQAFDMADGSACLKVSLSWAGHDETPECVRAIFEKPSVDWVSEALQIATTWLAGPPAVSEISKLRIAEPAEHAEVLAAVG